MTPLVSVIIPTKNSARTIGACIASIQRQTYSNTEIILVDNESTDDTRAIGEKMHVSVLQAGDELSAQRNAGAKQSRGAYVLFIDSDMELTPSVIEECVQIMETSAHIQAITILEESFGTTFWADCKQFERSCYDATPWLHSARFMRRELFAALFGYREDLIGAEDFDMQKRILGYCGAKSISRTSAKIRHNEGALTLRGLLKKKYYYGQNMDRYVQNKTTTAYALKQANPLHRLRFFFGRPDMIRKHPIIFLGTCFMKIMEFFALGLGYISKHV